MTTPRISLAVLDMAGTTVSDNGSVEAAVDTALASVGIAPITAEKLKPLRGMAKTDMFAKLAPDARHADAAHRSFLDTMLTAVGDGVLTPKPGALELFEALRECGISICLMTGFDAAVQRAVLDAFDWNDLVDLSASQTDGLRGRPHPDLILQAAIETQIDDVHQILVAGDTTNDLLAGTRAGAGTVIGVLGGAHDLTTLESAPHTMIATDLDDLRRRLLTT
ncbi:HAD family hydrolase [Microbacterium azadirachtae]|uniref:Phosphonatase-like hydrolase n=1 Tax=Microbacterium azadirachtae TaxID=582680 RepID=A0A1I6G613_9MICO|nr:HAD family hydrolase [Microbacterium azadirachtae]SDL35275.1 phosphonatase-like hydrolase [Microbacterium azadirachtae]SEF65982.1 phosphonatase-like hydrolase [Microbacterium azadirachtae]SEF66753.1 phosphonatase-like hydrolase [Microbacterium azadirachtae]SFR37636.1 phosphonatase-like hydrolase [Microbacterium azadirachtae]